MAQVLLDTTVLVDVLRGREGAARGLLMLRERGDTPCTCAINVEETVRGLREGERDRAAALLTGLTVIPLGRSEGELAGRWRGDYAKRGRTLAQADCLIASAASLSRSRLATGNPKDFPMTDQLEVEYWPAGE
ncbi:MAG: PIN domain-containing protein [Solirubrobacterales bacterium]